MAETYEVIIRLTGQNETSTVIGQVQGQLSGIDQGAQSATGSLNSMGTAIKAAVAGFILNQVRQFSEEMYRVGTEVRITNETFNALAGGADNAEMYLTRLRAATGGIVTDMTLAQGASKFFSMGLAENSDELTRLTELAVKLGGAMGNSASDSIDNFALLLSNESILRLDTFGISSERVRQRIDELLASGEALSRSDAFRMAVMEIGGQSLDRLGDAASAAETPIARLQTRFENLTNAISEFMTRGIDAGAMLLEMGAAVVTGTTAPQQAAAAEQQRLNAWSTVITQQIMDAMGGVPADTFANSDGLQQFVENILRYGVGDINAQDAQSVLNAGFPEFTPNAAMMDTTAYQSLIGYIYDYNAQLEESARLQRDARAADEERARAMAILSDTYYGGQSVLSGAFNPLLTAVRQSLQGMPLENDSTQYGQQLFGLFSGSYNRRDVGGLSLFSPQEAARARELFAEYENTLQMAERAHTSGLISDEQYARITGAREQIAQIASDIERGAAAFENLTLSQALGQGGGGLFGELGDSVLGQLQTSGLDEDQLQVIRDALDLTSGRQTEASLMLRDEVVPLLSAVAETYGSTELIVVMQRVEDALRQGQLAGLSDTQLALSMQGAVGYQFAGSGMQQFTVNPGDTVSGLSAQYGLSYEEIMTAAGITNPRMLQPGTYGAGQGALVPIDLSQAATDAPVVADSMTTIEDSTAGARDNVDAIQAALDQISGTSYTLQFDLQFNDPGGVLQLLGVSGADFAAAIQSTNRDAGGRSPGTNDRRSGGGSARN